MSKNPRCLYNSDFRSFIDGDIDAVFGALCDNYHGDALAGTYYPTGVVVPAY